MSNPCFDSLNDYLPIKVDGCNFLKRINVYVPIQVVILEILTKAEIKLPLVYKTVLSLISSGIHNINDIASKMGLEKKIMHEIIGNLYHEDFIRVIGMDAELTTKGKEALNDLKAEKIKKESLNNVRVNLVTQKIELESLDLYPQHHNNFCYFFDVEKEITFFKENFNDIDLYYNNVYPNKESEELYRIIGVTDSTIKFLELPCFVFQDKNNNLVFSFKEDELNKIYLPLLYQSFEEPNNELRQPLISPFSFRNLPSVAIGSFPKEEDLIIQNTNEFLNCVEKEDFNSLDTIYYKDRILLTGEIGDILNDFNDYNPTELIISSPVLRQFLINKSLIEYLFSIQSLKKMIFFYNENEYNDIKEMIDRVKKKNHTDKKVRDVEFYQNKTSFVYASIIADKKFFINTQYSKLIIKNNISIVSEQSTITFDLQKVKEERDFYLKFIE